MLSGPILSIHLCLSSATMASSPDTSNPIQFNEMYQQASCTHVSTLACAPVPTFGKSPRKIVSGVHRRSSIGGVSNPHLRDEYLGCGLDMSNSAIVRKSLGSSSILLDSCRSLSFWFKLLCFCYYVSHVHTAA